MGRYRNYTPTHRYTAPDGSKASVRSFLPYTHVLIGRRDLALLKSYWDQIDMPNRDALLAVTSTKFVVLQWLTEPEHAEQHRDHWTNQLFVDLQVDEIKNKVFK